MTRLLFACVLIISVSTMAFSFESDLQKYPSCTYCGMDRTTYAHSRVLIEYNDGSSFSGCSLHCAAVNLANNIDKTPTAIRVGDYNAKKLIDAERAFWVLGGTKAGVMTANAKWAFETRVAAASFIAENGGSLVTFDAAIKATYADMYQDTKRIRERRKLKRTQPPTGGVR